MKTQTGVWMDAQADLSFRWAHGSFCWFCRVAAYMVNPLIFQFAGVSVRRTNCQVS